MQARPLVAAWRGDEGQALALIESARRNATARGQGFALSMLECANALLFNGLGRYDEALAAAQRACAQDDLSLYALALAELIEAAARSGRPELAAAALERLGERTRASGTEWALGVEARSRALVTEGRSAEPLYEEAVERLSRGPRRPSPGPRPACVRGMAASREAPRGRARATSNRPRHVQPDRRRDRSPSAPVASCWPPARPHAGAPRDTSDVLTPQEAQIARLARDGFSNPDIGAQLFISPRTVQYHLHKVFAKLDITSRNQLGGVPARHLSTP